MCASGLPDVDVRGYPSARVLKQKSHHLKPAGRAVTSSQLRADIFDTKAQGLLSE